jgi:GH25 family lysozyme M1 (1,4-beta-N-acetylmuramidase)
MDVSFYHFLRFEVPPAEQAALMHSKWSEAHASGVHPKRYWLDVEDTETTGPQHRVTWLQELVSHLDGIPLGVYSANWYWRPFMENSADFSHLPLWTATYVPNEPATGDDPYLYGGWTDWEIWQWSSSGSVAGISGAVDMNVALG